MNGQRWLRRLVAAAVVTVSAATILAFLDTVAWPFELLTVFRLQYGVLLLALAPAALLLRSRRTAAAAVACALLNAAVVAPAADAPDAVAAAEAASLRVLVANVEVGNRRYGDLVRLVRKVRPDVIAVIELDRAWARQLSSRLRGYGRSVTVARGDAYGIGLFSRVPLLSAGIRRFPEGDGPPTVVARLRVRGSEPLTLVVTHVHTPFAGSIHERHLEALAEARAGLGARLAVCGDFNTVPWAAAFRRLAARGLSHLYAGRWPGYSWPTWSPLLRLPIDNCLVGGIGVTSHSHGPSIGSDHYPLIVDLSVPRR